MKQQKSTSIRRVSRACVYCRSRKTRCELGLLDIAPPCSRCKAEGRDCVLATSNRGGPRIRKRLLDSSKDLSNSFSAFGFVESDPKKGKSKRLRQEHGKPSLEGGDHDHTDHTSSGGSVSPTRSPMDSHSMLHNPSDAWQLLKDVANMESELLKPTSSPQQRSTMRKNPVTFETESSEGTLSGARSQNLASYRLVQEGCLTRTTIQSLVSRYAEHYHPYLPLVPRSYFQPDNLDYLAAAEPHLLTAILTIASKDLVEQPYIHKSVSRYMHELISGIVAGHDCDVEAVEGLLLLAEWEPHGLQNRIEEVGRGEEDRSAWMHIGLALRTGYFLGLDRTAFRQDKAEEILIDTRKRLAWAYAYISDRLVSVRIGRAFWSRGPGPMTGLSELDFPSLRPRSVDEEDYAQILRATLELTQLYSNVHDVLYSGMRTSRQMMLMGDYVKYVDDFRTALSRWHQNWGMIKCSEGVEVGLKMSFIYLNLYTNAFVFQAAISQAIASKPTHMALRAHLRASFDNIAGMPDARFITASISAAKSFLTLLSSEVDPIQHLRHMPLRFYLYSIYSAVFLYKARSIGAIRGKEEVEIRQMVRKSIETLKQASVTYKDAGSRYARLLELLWIGKTSVNSNLEDRNPSNDTDAGSRILQKTPSNSENSWSVPFVAPNDFSWLDLEAVGDFVFSDHTTSGQAIPAGQHVGFQQPEAFETSVTGMEWNQIGDWTNWQFDDSSNLLF